uniref:DNA ligase (NAD(+)) n=1 Tax=viral metagenome TaxID=1070528 RepID=A0A6C0J6E7_9ZZZZ
MGGTKVNYSTKKCNNVFIQNYRKDGISYIEQLNITTIKSIIKECNNAYYNTTPILTDDEFDILKDYIYKKDPKFNDKIGAKVMRNKVKLPYFMGSMNKIKPDTNALDKWIAKYSGPYVISTKLDGVSGLYTVENNVEKLYTRGDGTIGQDISHLIPYLRLPNKINKIAVRGEFIISKNNYNKIENKPMRNYVSGLINRLHIVPEDYKYVDFVAYELINPITNPFNQLTIMKQEVHDVVQFEKLKNINNKILSDKLIDWRNNYDYEIDGIIITCDHIYERKKGNPDHSIAFKMILDDQIVEAKVIDVEWSASKHGLLKPRVRFEEVIVNNVKINYATGFNAKFIMDNKIGLGAIIKLIRSGDVIPHILEVTKPAITSIMPTVEYTWTISNVDIKINNIQQNENVQVKRIADFYKKLDVKGVGPALSKKIHESGFITPIKIISMTYDDYKNIFGEDSKTATIIFTNIKKSFENVTNVQIINASNILGTGFGLTRLELIFEKYPELLFMEKNIAYNNLLNIEGLSTILASSFVEKLYELNSFIQVFRNNYKLKSKNENNNNDLKDINIVFTKIRNKNIEDEIKSRGGKISNSVTKNTTIVVIKDLNTTSLKIQKAKELGIKIITLEDFAKIIYKVK